MEVAGQKLVAFLPWLRLEQPVSVVKIHACIFTQASSACSAASALG